MQPVRGEFFNGLNKIVYFSFIKVSDVDRAGLLWQLGPRVTQGSGLVFPLQDGSHPGHSLPRGGRDDDTEQGGSSHMTRVSLSVDKT